eukprot:362913-Chlamydomonas_euryale.AAC.3
MCSFCRRPQKGQLSVQLAGGPPGADRERDGGEPVAQHTGVDDREWCGQCHERWYGRNCAGDHRVGVDLDGRVLRGGTVGHVRVSCVDVKRQKGGKEGIWWFGTARAIWWFGTARAMWWFGTARAMWWFGTARASQSVCASWAGV